MPGAEARVVRGRDTARRLIAWARARLAPAKLAYGHGTTGAYDDAVLLVFHALGLALDCPERMLDRPCHPARAKAARDLVRARIATRQPAAYLTGEMWFAGLPFHVDSRVLVPRSPIAELVETGFAPWIEPRRVRRVLDIGTGSGCIAIAAARALPGAHVDATDLSTAALEVAARNVARHRLRSRVRLLPADLYPRDARLRYDVIVSNPPYVRAGAIARFPREYRHEPRLGLDGGRDGLDLVRRILAGASARLRADGVLIVEVGGGGRRALERAYPRLPFVWVEFARGGDGVFVLTRAELEAAGL